MLKDLCRRKATQVLWGPCSWAGISGAPWDWLEGGGLTPGDNHLWPNSACMNCPLVLAVPLGSAGLRYVNIRQITCRERKPALVNKNQGRPELPLWRRKHSSLVSFTEQGICPDPGGTCDPSPGHQNLGTVLWPRLNHHSWLCSCILMLCTYCHILGCISYSELKLLSRSNQFLLIWKSWTLNSCCLTSWNINIRLERWSWLGALNIRNYMHQTVLFFQDHLWQCCPVIMS